MSTCDWAVEKEGRLRILEMSTEERRRETEEEEPESHTTGSHKYWGFLR